MLALPDGDTAGHGALVVDDAIVGELEIVVPGMSPDCAAALGTVLDRQAVDAGWVAIEVAGELIGPRRSVRSATGGSGGGSVQERGCLPGRRGSGRIPPPPGGYSPSPEGGAPASLPAPPGGVAPPFPRG